MTAAKPCPVCKKPPTDAFKPFCSKRCSEVDLGRWLTGTYRVETNETPETEKLPTEE